MCLFLRVCRQHVCRASLFIRVGASQTSMFANKSGGADAVILVAAVGEGPPVAQNWRGEGGGEARWRMGFFLATTDSRLWTGGS